MKKLDNVYTFKNVEYRGRFVRNKEDDNILIFEESLGDILSPYICGDKECDEETWKQVCEIDENIWCYVPKDVLQRSDKKVIKWCEEHSIDV